MSKPTIRCDWAKSEIEQVYHDTKWGVPEYNDKELFKMLMLEGMQAGLSWITILKKMDALCEAFDNFDPDIVQHYDEHKEAELLQNENIIRNRLKIKSAAVNAKAYFEVSKEFGSFSNYLWQFVEHQPIVNEWQTIKDVPAKTELSDKISKDLKKRGFKFVGSTIIYAFMQAVGMVNDHLVDLILLLIRQKNKMNHLSVASMMMHVLHKFGWAFHAILYVFWSASKFDLSTHVHSSHIQWLHP